MTVKPTRVHPQQVPARYPWWFTPPVLIFVPVLLSMSTWALVVLSDAPKRLSPDISTRLLGFYDPARVTLPGVFLLVTFYLFLAWVALLGWELGSASSKREPAERQGPQISERRYFFLILAVAAVGVGYCYYKAASQQSVVGTLSAQLGNKLYDSLPQNAGIQTLRYACILAAPLGVYLWRKKVISAPLMVIAVSILGFNALLSSRLSLLMAACVYLTLWVRTREPSTADPRRRRRYVLVVLATLAAGFLALTALNYARNANFYRAWGASNPVAMNLYQSSQYLSVPAQVSVGVADAVATGKWGVSADPLTSLDAIKPTFLQAKKVRKSEFKKYSDYYGFSVTFLPQALTNSVFADIYADYGAWGWLYIFPLYGLAGYLMARLMRGEPVVAATGGVIAYCFAEVWRIQILSFGFVIFLLLLTVAARWIATVEPAQEITGRPARLR